MLLDYDVSHSTRRCAATGRTLEPGEVYYSSLHMENGAPVRRDFCGAAWQTPDAAAVAWWKTQIPRDDAKPELAPSDVLLNLFAELAASPHEAEFRYVLGLVLLRRRLLRFEECRRDAAGESLVLECPRRDERFVLRAAAPSAERVAQLEQRLVDLLYGGS